MDSVYLIKNYVIIVTDVHMINHSNVKMEHVPQMNQNVTKIYK